MSSTSPSPLAFPLLSTALALAACTTSPSGESSGESSGASVSCEHENAEFEASVAAFEALVAEYGDTYYFTYVDSPVGGQEPVDSGCVRTYLVEVVDGVPVRRSLELSAFGDQDLESCGDPWIEEGDELGTHGGQLSPWTMEQHYELCCSAVLGQPKQDNSIYVSTFDNGVLSHCSYVPMSCADGCGMAGEPYPYGISLSSFAFGEAP